MLRLIAPTQPPYLSTYLRTWAVVGLLALPYPTQVVLLLPRRPRVEKRQARTTREEISKEHLIPLPLESP